jgi:hypothetical protein
MSDEVLEDLQRLWLMNHAQMAFLAVGEASNHIIKCNLKYGDELFYPLFTSIVINYARPFKKSRIVGKLVDEMVPHEWEGLHKELIIFRDTLIAHSDGDGPIDKWGKVNEVRYRIAKSHFICQTSQFHIPPEKISKVRDLSKLLVDKVVYHIKKLERKHLDKFPKIKGDYVLNIDPEIDEHFILGAVLDNAKNVLFKTA